MRRFGLISAVLLLFSWTCPAQTGDADAPASKEDIQRYLDVIHSRELTRGMVTAMSQGTHQMMHELYLKHQNELPPDYESKMTAMMDDMLRGMPLEDMMKAMVPVYQKHFTKGDIDQLVAFYGSPTGQKILRQMPAIMAEAMQTMTPVMTKYVDTMQKRLQKETDVMIAQNKKPAVPTHN